MDPGRDSSSDLSNGDPQSGLHWLKLMASLLWRCLWLETMSLAEAGISRWLLKVLGCSISWAEMSGLMVALAETQQVLSASGPSKEVHLRDPVSRP